MHSTTGRQSDFHVQRDRAILAFLLFTGARRGELLNLQWDDVDLPGQTVRFVGAKGDESRQRLKKHSPKPAQPTPTRQEK
jgi:integrase